MALTKEMKDGLVSYREFFQKDDRGSDIIEISYTTKWGFNRIKLFPFERLCVSIKNNMASYERANIQMNSFINDLDVILLEKAKVAKIDTLIQSIISSNQNRADDFSLGIIHGMELLKEELEKIH